MSNVKNLKKSCVGAMLAAVFVALEILSMELGKVAFLDNYQLPLSCFPLIIASLMLGPVWGTATGIIGSFLSQVVGGYGITWSSLIWMAPTIIYSFVIAILYVICRKSDKPYILTIEFFIGAVILSTANTVAIFVDSLITGYPYEFLEKFFKLFYSVKLVGGFVFAIIFALTVPTIVKQLKRVIKL